MGDIADMILEGIHREACGVLTEANMVDGEERVNEIEKRLMINQGN